MQPKKQPLISVLLPVCNGENFLAQAIQSILEQTIKSFELICINDGSTDKTAAILSKFAKKDKRIKILTNPKNIGMAASLNRALKLAKGKYIARMDSDDISLPNRFEKQIELLKSNPKLVAVGGQEEIIDAQGQVYATKLFPTDPEVCYQTLANVMPIQPPLLMVRGSVFRSLRYNTKICRNDDINIYFKLLQHGLLSNVAETVFQYRQLSNSLTHNNAKSVYFMALRNRLDGILNYGYRPNINRLAILAVETILISLIPSFLIVKLFEILRYQKQRYTLALPSFGISPLKAD